MQLIMIGVANTIRSVTTDFMLLRPSVAAVVSAAVCANAGKAANDTTDVKAAKFLIFIVPTPVFYVQIGRHYAPQRSYF
jgi:hypothetical protein